MKFELYLHNSKLKTYLLITHLMIALNTAALLAFFFSFELGNKAKFAFIFALIANGYYILVNVMESFFTKLKLKPDTFTFAIFLISAIAWLRSDWWWASILMLTFGLLHYFNRRSLVVTFTEEEIVYPSVPKKNIAWTELSNVILKDDLLTIDFRNNRLIQQMTIPAEKIVSEKEFNAFCQKQLAVTHSPTD